MANEDLQTVLGVTLDEDAAFWDIGARILSRRDLIEMLMVAEQEITAPSSLEALTGARRQWWLAVGAFIYQHMEDPSKPIPTKIAADLYAMTVDLAAGLSPEITRTQAHERGRRPEEPKLWGAKRSAVDYIVAAKAGLIADEDPVATVCAHFEIADRRVVQRWTRDLRYQRPDGGALTAAIVAEDKIANLEIPARFFRALSASHSAIRERVRRRPRKGK